MASTGLSKTFSSSPTNNKKGTMSFWMKRSALGSCQIGLTVAGAGGGNCGLQFGSDDRLYMYLAYSGGTWYGEFLTNRKFRDTNSWYHIVITWDTTQATSTNRMKLYVNGVQETSLATANYPDQDRVTTFGNATAHYINYWNNSGYFDGVMSHLHYTDGYSYDASAFGSTDSTTGEWKITTSPSVTYGTNGFFILKNDNSVTDQSGNSNNWTVASGTLTKTEDNPSNVFATLNPLVYSSASPKTYGHGNNSITASDSGNWCSTQSTIGASSGKYYCEIKINAVGSFHALGVGYQPNISNTTSTQLIGELTGSAGWRNNGALVHGGSNINTYTTGDILMIAMDLDNQKLYFGKNGTWENSGDPTSGATGTGSLKDLTANEYYHFVICPRGGSTYCNFGNGYFGTTAVSSAGTNASNIGIFEYDVPTGYTALSTKGLNE